MPINDKIVDEDTKSAAATIVKTAKWLLRLEDFNLKEYCKPARAGLLTLLSNVEEKQYLEILEEKGVKKLVEQLNVSLRQISANVTRKEKSLAVYIESGLEERKKNVEEKIQRNNKTIVDLKARLEDTKNNKQPNFWSSYLADSNPGFFKSIFLFFIWQSAIDKARNVWINFNNQIDGFEKKIQILTHKNQELGGLKYSYESQLADKEELEENLIALKISKTSLEAELEGLKKAADILSIKDESKLNEGSEFADSESTKLNNDVVTEDSEDDEDTFHFQW